jgi:CBS domain-containing protein
MATVEDILMAKGPSVITAIPSITAHEAVKMMCEANVGSVVVTDEHKVIGIFTERDLLRRVIAPGRDPATTEISQVMSTPVHHVGLATSARKCAEILNREHIRHLAIIEDDSLLGMISLRDVLTAELAEDEEILRKKEEETS